MRPRVGVAVGTEHAAAVLVAGGRVAWSGTIRLALFEMREQALQALCERIPRHRWLAPRARVALATPEVVCKSLYGTPRLNTPRQYEGVVRAQATRFFLRTDTTLLIGTAVVPPAGAPIIVAFEEGAVAEIARALRAAGLRHIEAFCPPPRAPAPPAVDEPEGLRAMAASVATTSLSLVAHLPTQRIPGSGEMPRWRLRLAAGAAVAAALVLVLGPLVVADARARSARRELRRVEPGAATAMAEARALSTINDRERALRALLGDRPAALAVLARLASGLPERTQLVSLRLDSTSVTAQLLTADPAATLALFERMPGWANAELVGPVTHQTDDEGDLERLSVRARIVKGARE